MKPIKLIDIINELGIGNSIPNFNQDLEKLLEYLEKLLEYLEKEDNFIRFIKKIPFEQLNWAGFQTDDDIGYFIQQLTGYYKDNEQLTIDIYEDDEDWKANYLFIETDNGDSINISFSNSFKKDIEVNFGPNLIAIEVNTN